MSADRVAVGLGIGFALLTTLELTTNGWALGDTELLIRTTKSNLLHWALALALVGCGIGGGAWARNGLKATGVLLLGLAVWGLVASGSLGGLLGLSGGVPATYQLIHLGTALLALGGGWSTLLSRPRAEP